MDVDPLSRDALRATEFFFSLILVRGSQSYLSWFIVSLFLTIKQYYYYYYYMSLL